MKMLLLVFRSTFSDEVIKILDGLDLPGYTESPRVYGTGTMGRVFDSHAWPGYNSMVLSAMSEPDAKRLAAAIKAFSVSRATAGEQVPSCIFAVPCERLL